MMCNSEMDKNSPPLKVSTVDSFPLLRNRFILATNLPASTTSKNRMAAQQIFNAGSSIPRRNTHYMSHLPCTNHQRVNNIRSSCLQLS